jgi:hypothetical protein
MSATAESPAATGDRPARADTTNWLARLNRALVERVRLRRTVDGGLIALYIAIWSSCGLIPFNTTDLEAFFFPAARIALEGHPFGVYAVRLGDAYPNANGPLSLVPLTAVGALAQLLGWIDILTFRRALIFAVFAIFPLLLAREGLRTIARLNGKPLTGFARYGVFALFLFSPLLWQGMLGYGHIELAIMLWLLLLGVNALADGRAGWAGVFLGLALLTRSSALVYVTPLLGVTLWQRRWNQAARFVALYALVVVAGLAPFLLADRENTLFSLVNFRGELPVGGYSIWGMLIGTPWETFAKHYDSLVVLGAALLVTLLALLIRRDLDVASRDFYVLLALCGLCFTLFIKTVWPYYLFEPYVFIVAWWIPWLREARAQWSWLVWSLAMALPIALIAAGALVDYRIYTPPTAYANDLVQWSRNISLLVGSVTLILLIWLAGGRIFATRLARYNESERALAP